MAEAAAQKPSKAQPLTRKQLHKLAVRKRVRHARERQLRNQSIRSFLRTTTKSFLGAIEAGDAEKARQLYERCSREFDQAAAKGIIHRNAANRKKARLALKLHDLLSPSTRQRPGRPHKATPPEASA